MGHFLSTVGRGRRRHPWHGPRSAACVRTVFQISRLIAAVQVVAQRMSSAAPDEVTEARHLGLQAYDAGKPFEDCIVADPVRQAA